MIYLLACTVVKITTSIEEGTSVHRYEVAWWVVLIVVLTALSVWDRREE